MKNLIIISLGAQTGTDRKTDDLSAFLLKLNKRHEVYNIFQPIQIKNPLILKGLMSLKNKKGGRFIALLVADLYVFKRSFSSKEQISVLASTYPLIGVFNYLNKYTKSYRYFYYIPDMMWNKSYLTNSYWKIFKIFAFSAIRNCNTILVPTASARLDLITYIAPSLQHKIKYMREYVNSDYWNNIESKKPQGITDNFRYHFFPGALKKSKNIYTTLKSLELYQNSFPDDYLVVLFQKKSLFEYLEKYHRNHNPIDVEKLKVKYLSNIADTEMKWLYQNCKSLLIPSIEEGVGLPILEANLFRVPVITSIISAMPETSSFSAIYVDPFCENSICNGIFKSISHKETELAGFKYGLKKDKTPSLMEDCEIFYR
jgi:glycosyltransferase involved in cell wall biosynthesis